MVDATLAQPPKKLTKRESDFVAAYVANRFNGAAAARTAGYSAKSAAEIAYENLRKPHIEAAVKERTDQEVMSADEVKLRLSDQARGSIEPFLVTNGNGDLLRFDLSEDKPLHLLKKASITETEFRGVTKRTTTIEMYDAHAAQVDIGRTHGIFVDKTALTDPTGTKEYADSTLDALRERLITQLTTPVADSGASDLHPQPATVADDEAPL